MKPPLPSDEAVSFRIASACTTLTIRAAADLEALPETLEERVHAIRVAMKRLDALLRLFPRSSHPDAFQRTVRRTKKFLGAYRDASVGTALLREIGADERTLAGFSSAGHAVWSGRASLRAARLAVGLCPAALEGLGTDCETALAAWLAGYRRARKLAARCVHDRDAARLHDLRKAVKRLVYQSEPLDSFPPVHPVAVRAMHLAALLGRHNDFVVLAENAVDIRPDMVRRLHAARQEAAEAALAAARDCFPEKTAHLRRLLA